MHKLTLLLFSTFLSIAIHSQDTIRLMHYNLLNYGNYWSDCTESNNNVSDKNEYLKTIVDYVKPDILTVNEIYKSSFYHTYLLNGVFNNNGVDYFEKGSPPNNGNSYIMNQIFYNGQKFNLISNSAISTNYRDIDIFRLVYNSDEQVQINCVVAHLKAGSDNEDEDERAYETYKLMNYLINSSASGNYLIHGDFNVYTSAEQAYQNLLYHSNTDIRFYDPLETSGSWNNNSYFASVHTQSTHTSGSCFSGGGMDDRFDFILVSDEVIQGSHDVKYIPNSYKAVGQDGQHFNKSLTSSPTNTSIPSDVLDALYSMSDHLPIIIDLVVGDNVGIKSNQKSAFKIVVKNPIDEKIFVTIKTQKPQKYLFEVLDIYGKILKKEIKNIYEKTSFNIHVKELRPGLYFLRATDSHGSIKTSKLLKR